MSFQALLVYCCGSSPYFAELQPLCARTAACVCCLSVSCFCCLPLLRILRMLRVHTVYMCRPLKYIHACMHASPSAPRPPLSLSTSLPQLPPSPSLLVADPLSLAHSLALSLRLLLSPWHIPDQLWYDNIDCRLSERRQQERRLTQKMLDDTYPGLDNYQRRTEKLNWLWVRRC